MSATEKVDIIRKLFALLPREMREKEANRQLRILGGKPIFLLETPAGECYRCDTQEAVKATLFELTGKRYNSAQLYKVIVGEQIKIGNVTVTKIYETDDGNDIIENKEK